MSVTGDLRRLTAKQPVRAIGPTFQIREKVLRRRKRDEESTARSTSRSRAKSDQYDRVIGSDWFRARAHSVTRQPLLRFVPHQPEKVGCTDECSQRASGYLIRKQEISAKPVS